MTGSTDLRDTEVQQPKITSTPETVMSSRAFSAKSGQSEAGSTTTASSGRPSRPPLAFCSATSISTVSLSVVSEMAIVPDSECSTPTLIGSPSWASAGAPATAVASIAAAMRLVKKLMIRQSPLSRAASEADGSGPVVYNRPAPPYLTFRSTSVAPVRR